MTEKSFPVRAALLALRFYKAYCRFVCGKLPLRAHVFALRLRGDRAIWRKHGIWLGLKRLLRCHPLSRKFGYDPVSGEWEVMPTNSVQGKL